MHGGRVGREGVALGVRGLLDKNMMVQVTRIRRIANANAVSGGIQAKTNARPQRELVFVLVEYRLSLFVVT